MSFYSLSLACMLSIATILFFTLIIGVHRRLSAVSTLLLALCGTYFVFTKQRITTAFIGVYLRLLFDAAAKRFLNYLHQILNHKHQIALGVSSSGRGGK